MTMVDWKGVGLIEFPEDMSQEDINQRLSDQEFYFDEQFGIPSDPGFWAEIMPDAVERGFRKTVMGIQAARSLNPDLPIIGLSNEEAATAIREQQARINDIPMSEEARSVLQDVMYQDFFEAVGTMIVNPGAAASIIGEGLGGSVPAAAATVAAVAVPSLMGLALSPLGAIAAGGTAAGAASFATEYANTLIDHMMDDGDIDVMDVDEVAAALGNEELMAEAKESAVARGIPVGFVDAAAFALGGVFSNFVKAGRGGAKAGIEVGEDYIKVAPDKFVKETPVGQTEIDLSNPRSRAFELAGMTSMETAGGIGGEALAQLSDEGAINRPGELAIEGLAQGLIGGPTNLVSYMAADYAAKRKAGVKPNTSSSPIASETDISISPEIIEQEIIASETQNSLKEGISTPVSERIAEQTEEIKKLQEQISKTSQEIDKIKDPVKADRKRQVLRRNQGRLANLQKSVKLLSEAPDMAIVENLYQPKRPPKSTPGSLRQVFASLGSRGTVGVEQAASMNPEIRDMLETIKTFPLDTLLRKGQLVSELEKITQPFKTSFRIPIVGTARKGSAAYGYNVPAMNALGKALQLDSSDLTTARLNEIMDAEKVPAQYREAMPNAVEQGRKFYDKIYQQDAQAGIKADYLEGYLGVDVSEAFSTKKALKKSIEAVSKKIPRAEAEKIMTELYEKYNDPDVYVTHLDTLISSGKVNPSNNPTFAKARTLAPRIREALIESGVVSSDFHNVTMRRINQSSIAQPIASRIEPIRKKINKMLEDGNLSRTEIQGLGSLRDVTFALEGKTPSGRSLPSGVRRPYRVLVAALYGSTLPLAGLTSLSEFAAIFAYLGPGTPLYGLRKAMFEFMPRKIIRSMKPNYPKSALEQEFEKFMVYLSAPQMAERMTAQSVTDYSTKFTEVLFVTNMLTQITQVTRAAAAFSFDRAIRNASETVQTADKSSKEYKRSRKLLRQLGMSEKQLGEDMSEQFRQMLILNGVNLTVQAPDATTRPLWMSNPYLAPVALLTSFTASFGVNIGKMIWDEVVAGETSYGDKLSFQERASAAVRYASMLTLLMAGIAATTSLKEAIKYWDEDDVPSYTDRDLTGMTIKSFVDTGVLGMSSRLIDIFDARQYGRDPFTAAAGPVAGKFSDWVIALSDVLSEGDVRRVVREAIKMIPGYGSLTSGRRDLEDAIMEEINSLT